MKLKLFETKYRIMPVYRNDERTGFVVYQKSNFLCFWSMMTKDTLVIAIKPSSKNTNIEVESVDNKSSAAFFKTEKEAKEYIEYIKKEY